MKPTAQLLADFERCERLAFWSRNWERRYLSSKRILELAIEKALTDTTRKDTNELAGETILELAEDRGLDAKTFRVYDSALHHAALADILSFTLRKPGDAPWVRFDAQMPSWSSGAFLGPGSTLRRLCLASYWSADREQQETRSWNGLGEVAMTGMPMDVAVLVIGQLRDGWRRSHWTQALRHPHNNVIRFKKREASRATDFGRNWLVVRREQDDRYTTEMWWNAMQGDGVVRDLAFSFRIEVPEKSVVTRIKDMAARKLERLEGFRRRPPRVLACGNCPMISVCWEDYGPEPDERLYIPVT